MPQSVTFPKGWYRNKWWVTHDDHDVFYGSGIYGQHLWIDPVAQVVIAKFSSRPRALDAELGNMTRLGFRAMIDALTEKG